MYVLLFSALALVGAVACGNGQQLPIGSPCATNSDCGGDAFFCAKGDHPNGYCKKDCSSDGDCPTGSICAFSGAVGECHKSCDADADCRVAEGYACHPASDDPDEMAGHAFCDVKEAMPQTLYVAHEGTLVSYDISSGMERPGTVTNVTGPVDLQALADGTLLVDLTGRNEILVVDGATMLEKARLPASAMSAARPVHSYISPTRDGKTYWVSLNDGNAPMANTSARFVDVSPESATYLMPVGEVAVGIGHHKATFSATQPRIVVSNIADCDNVLSVYDYSNVASISKLATFTSAQDGFGMSKPCNVSSAVNSDAPRPHGCATAKATGKAYCNMTGTGDLVVIDIDAATPTFSLLQTSGARGGYTKPTGDGHFVFSLQGEPSEASMSRPGAKCQVGQLVVVDATTDMVVKQLPLLYKGPNCTDTLKGTDEETVGPSHMQLSRDGRTLFVTVAGGFGVATARSRQELVVDVSDPANATQLASIPVGTSSGDHGDALSGNGAFLFVTNTVDGTVTQIDVAAKSVVKTITTMPSPKTLATFGGEEGPSHQTGPL